MRASPRSPALSPQARRPRRALALAAGGAVALAALASLELWLRWSGREAPPTSCKRPELFERHDPHGYRLKPSRTIDYAYPPIAPRTLAIRANGDGFRGRELREADPRPRLAVLGDSFVYGEGVEEAERFTDALERRQPAWRVDNLGLPGFGLDLMLRALQEVGLPLRPRAVLLCVYTDDFRRVHPRYAGVGFPIPRFELAGGELRDVPYPSTFFDRFRVARALARRLGVEAGASSAEPSQSHFELNRAILDRFRALAAEHGFQLGLVFLPGRDDAPVDRERRSWLAAYAEREGVPFADLTGVLRAAGSAVFLERNWHYSAAGHELVAAELERFLGRWVGAR
jgi:hypothetical protein